MSEIKLLVFDIDGTLINGAGKVSANVKRALSEVAKSGVNIALASGRPWFAAEKLVEELNVGAASVFYGGALLVNPQTGVVFCERHINSVDISGVLAEVARRDLYCELYTANDYYVEALTPMSKIHSEYLGRLPKVMSFSQLLLSQEILKLVIVIDRVDCYLVDELSLALPNITFATAYGAAHSELAFVNITGASVDKKATFQRMLDIEGCHADQVIAFGDAESDREFIGLAGTGVAMGNACASIKSVADFITRDVEADGVAYAIQQLLPQFSHLHVEN